MGKEFINERVGNTRVELGNRRAKPGQNGSGQGRLMRLADDGSPTRPWGEQLRAWREEAKRWSRAEFRNEIEAAAYKLRENRGQKLDERLIARWETGAVARPQGVYCRILAHLGAPIPLTSEQIVPQSTVDAVEMWGCRANLEMLCEEVGHMMQRRSFIMQSGLTLVSVANPWLLDPVDQVVDSIDGRRVGHATVTDIESITAARRRMDDALGGGSLLSAVCPRGPARVNRTAHAGLLFG